MDPWERRWVDYYDLFGLQPSADPDVISAVYRQLARRYALKGGSAPDEDSLRVLNEAKDVLLDSSTRARFDQARRNRPRASSPRAPGAPDHVGSSRAPSAVTHKHALWVAREADVIVDRSKSDAELLRTLLIWGDAASIETPPAGPPLRQTERLVLLTNEHPQRIPGPVLGLKPILRITEVLAALPDMGLVPADTAALLAAGPDPRFDCGAPLFLAFGTVFRDSDSTRWFPRLVSGPTERPGLIPTRYDANVAFDINANLETYTRVLAIRPPAMPATLSHGTVHPSLRHPPDEG